MAKHLKRVDNIAIFNTTMSANGAAQNAYSELHVEWSQFLSAIAAEDDSLYAQTGKVLEEALDEGKKIQCFREFNLDYDISDAVARKFLRYIRVGRPLDYYVLRDQLIRLHDALIAFQVDVPSGATALGQPNSNDPAIADLQRQVGLVNGQIDKNIEGKVFLPGQLQDSEQDVFAVVNATPILGFPGPRIAAARFRNQRGFLPNQLRVVTDNPFVNLHMLVVLEDIEQGDQTGVYRYSRLERDYAQLLRQVSNELSLRKEELAVLKAQKSELLRRIRELLKPPRS